MLNNKRYSIRQISIMTKIFFLLCMLPFIGNAQEIGVGASAMYNFQSEGFGVGARVNFYPNNRFSFVPQASYYSLFSFSDVRVTEYNVGLSVEYKVIQGNRFNSYLLGHAAFNHWLNSDESPLEDAQPINWNLEGGIGIATNSCLRPFLEYRYNIKFQETHLRLGLLYIFGCKGDQMTGRYGNGYRDPKRIRKTNICPAY